MYNLGMDIRDRVLYNLEGAEMAKKTDTSIYPPEIVRLRQEALRVSGSCPDEGKWEISPGDLLSTMRFVLWHRDDNSYRTRARML